MRGNPDRREARALGAFNIVDEAVTDKNRLAPVNAERFQREIE